MEYSIQRHLVEMPRGHTGARRRSKPKCERMTIGEPQDRATSSLRYSGSLEQLGRLRLLEGLHAKTGKVGAEYRIRGPLQQRRLPARDDDAYATRESRHEHVAQPGVQEAKCLVVVEGEYEWRPGQLQGSRELLDVLFGVTGKCAEPREKPSLRGFYGRTVQACDR
jgi:hypothetical protein